MAAYRRVYDCGTLRSILEYGLPLPFLLASRTSDGSGTGYYGSDVLIVTKPVMLKL